MLESKSENSKTELEKSAIENVDEQIISPEFLAEQKIAEMQVGVVELERNGEEQIENANNSIGLDAENVSEARINLGIDEKLSDIAGRTRELFEKLKEKVSKLFAKEKSVDTTTEKLENGKRPEYSELKDYLKREQREISGPVIEEAKRKRNQLLEARGILSMSRDDFDTNFSSREFEASVNLEQQNVGDCYAVAAIHAMSRSPHFEMICRSSMKRFADGSWQVRVPLMSKNGQVITITPEELLPQKNRQFLRRSEKGGIMPDLRRKLMPVKGKEGLQVLEAAFIKQKFGSVDRLAAEGGWGDEVLLSLGGDNFKKYSIKSNIYNSEKEKWEYPGLSSIDEKKMAYLDHYLENFDPEIHMATVSTKHSKIGEAIGFYKARGMTAKFLVPGHAYSIHSVDAEKRVVNLANPWDTSKPIKLTFDQFKENFSGFEAIRIDSANLLSSIIHVAEKKAA